jgi:aconitate hydratase
MDSYGTRGTLEVGGRTYTIARLKALRLDSTGGGGWDVARLPFTHRILLENLLRNEDGVAVDASDIEAVATWDPAAKPSREIQFTPGRVLMQDFTGVPAVVDLAAMRDAMAAMGGDPSEINPLQPAELVIDHSVQVDKYGSPDALEANNEIEFGRNRERYSFLRWGQTAFENFKVVPPNTGIVHQVNLEHLARVVMDATCDDVTWAFPDTLVGTDSHTTMINGLGVLGWGVGGIEAEAAMLGQPVSMLIPQVVGVRLSGKLPEGATATDLVLRVVELLREHGVVGKFVEFCGSGLAALPLADRATLANMAPEYGATCGIFPIDEKTLDYLRLTGRSDERIALVEAYAKEQGLFHDPEAPEAQYSEMLEVDMGTIVPSLAGPKRPQDRVALSDLKRSFESELTSLAAGTGRVQKAAAAAEGAASGGVAVAEPEVEHPIAVIDLDGETVQLEDGSVVIAAVTSCTNTSNPSVMIGAGLLAKKAVERGLKVKPWVKTSLAPGSRAVTEYLVKAGLLPYLEQLGFHVVGYGCTTCIGNSGPLPPAIATGVEESGLVVASVLSGNRNFEGRVHQLVRANYLASPPLVVAFALAGHVDVDLTTEPIGTDENGQAVYLKDIWPTPTEIQDLIQSSVQKEMFERSYGAAYDGDENWRGLDVPEGATYAWHPDSTYVKHPPYFTDMPREAPGVADISGARVLCFFGDSVTTDHISPAGAIKPASPAGEYLLEHGVERAQFNSYGSRRGNHEVMMRGTFANVRIRNKLVPGVEGGVTRHLPGGEQLPIFDAAMRYKDEGVATVVIAGKEYGTGSSRDWAAKGPYLLGVRAVIAESYERIHRSNLIGMGVLPLQFKAGESAESLGLTGEETFSITGLKAAIEEDFRTGGEVSVSANGKSFMCTLRIDTPNEVQYYRNGGILHYVLRKLLAS